MSTPTSDSERRTHLYHLVSGSRTVMLLSHGADGAIVGRPMALVRTDDDLTLYLVSGIDTKKVTEVKSQPRCSVSLQTSHGFAIIDGDVRVSQDRGLIDELWDDTWKVWFEGGKADPRVAIMIITAREGSYWDQDLGSRISFVLRMIKARVTGGELEVKPGDQETVALHRH